MADERRIKQLQELSIARKTLETADVGSGTLKQLIDTIETADEKTFDFKSNLREVFKLVSSVTDNYEIQEKLLKEAVGQLTNQTKKQKSLIALQETLEELEIKKLKLEKESEKVSQRQKKNKEAINKIQQAGNKLLQDALKYTQELFEISHKMQLEGNLTWKQYTEHYNKAFEAARRVNQELGQSVFNSKEMLGIQQQLISDGWKGLTAANLGNISQTVGMMTRVLGAFPQELNIAFQKSYRTLGEQTNQYITALGNRLNAFSNTFGMSLGMMSTLVSEMTSSNNFIARTNMRAQISANESLLKAAALSAEVGLTSTSFISNLAGTAQFGTADEMSILYQGGAYLRGFDTTLFRDQLRAANYDAAIGQLFGSISQTLGGMQEGYLRNEYMRNIGQAFGLSRDDLLQITQNAGNQTELREKIINKLANVETSMKDELSDLKLSVVDRLDNWWKNTELHQSFSKIFQDTGLIGVDGHLKAIIGILSSIRLKQSGQGFSDILGKLSGSNLQFGDKGYLKSLFVKPTQTGLLPAGQIGGSSMVGNNLTGLGKVGLGLGGLTLGVGSNVYGYNQLAKVDKGVATGSQVGGWLANTLGGTAGGAMAGFAVGGPVGAGIGAIAGLLTGIATSVAAEEKKKRALADYEKSARENRKLQVRSQAPIQTGDPVVDAINNMNDNLSRVISGELNLTRQQQYMTNVVDKVKPAAILRDK